MNNEEREDFLQETYEKKSDIDQTNQKESSSKPSQIQ